MRKRKEIHDELSGRSRQRVSRRVERPIRAPDTKSPIGQINEGDIHHALSAILALTQGGMENARKVIASVASDSEAAALIAKSSWGSAGGVTLTDGAGYVEGRNQTIMLRLGERKLTLTPAQWVSRVRRMFGKEVGRYDDVAHDAGVCIDAGEPSYGPELQDSEPY